MKGVVCCSFAGGMGLERRLICSLSSRRPLFLTCLASRFDRCRTDCLFLSPSLSCFLVPPTSNGLHVIAAILFIVVVKVILRAQQQHAGQQAVIMMSNSVSNALILSFLLLLSFECVRCQTLQEEIAILPACSTSCIAKGATSAKCSTTDYTCQCAAQDSMIGAIIAGRPSLQATCLLGDCGISNMTSEYMSAWYAVCWNQNC